jgi:chemotaxis protein methyltransferase CheR
MTEVGGPIPETSLSALSSFISSHMGLHFPLERWGDLARGLCSAAREFGIEDTETCIQWLMSSPLSERQIETLASYLTVGETYFFRDKPGLEAFEQRILPELIESRRMNSRHLKIWSAGCATGEEAYTLAILLNTVIQDPGGWNIDIIGTDINSVFLQTASQGDYGKWSFRGVPDRVKKRYFTAESGGKLKIDQHIKEMVSFQYLNLAEDSFPAFMNNIHGMDVIFCRNVLLYFNEEQALRVINGLYRSLADGGWLVVAPCDLLHLKSLEIFPVDSENPALFRKGFPSQPVCPLPATSTTPLKPETRRSPRPETQNPKEPTAGGEHGEALVQYQAGQYDAAADTLMEALSVGSDTEPAERKTKMMILLARVRANQGNFTEALVWCERMIAADQLNPAGYYLRSCILLEEGRTEEAAGAIRQALFLEPDFILGHFVLGNVAVARRDQRKAEQCFRHALHLLHLCPEDQVISESEGVTAGRLTKIIEIAAERKIV